MNTQLTIPTGGANGSFQVKFTNDGTPQPRYLGRSTNRNRMEHLRNAAPPIYYKLGGEPDAIKPNDRSLAAFRHKVSDDAAIPSFQCSPERRLIFALFDLLFDRESGFLVKIQDLTCKLDPQHKVEYSSNFIPD
jgi:hypothetical protein